MPIRLYSSLSLSHLFSFRLSFFILSSFSSPFVFFLIVLPVCVFSLYYYFAVMRGVGWITFELVFVFHRVVCISFFVSFGCFLCVLLDRCNFYVYAFMVGRFVRSTTIGGVRC